MRARSPKRAKQEREYTRLRRDFLEANPWCALKGCGLLATEVHHRRGRVGALLLAVEHWSPLCHDCHVWATGHPAAAYELGISERRIGEAS